ncbi:MAG: UDP-glucuronic acid decarboxylase family protein [Candidatus Magasanikbacteria bacterium]
MPSNKTVLVTGGAGFIGSHLCEKLVKKGERVICVDNLYTGKIEKIDELFEKEPNFEFINHDIRQPLEVEQNLDEIYNLACPASPKHYQDSPIFTMMTSVKGTKNILDLAAENDAKLLQASTSEVYGDPTTHPQTEDYNGSVNCTGPRACYDEGKRAAESLCFDYEREKDLNIKVIRIFNTYGPKMNKDDGRVIPNFINQALKGKDLTVYGDGTQTRSFCYIDDMIAGLLKTINQPEPGPFNLGNPKECSILELAEKVIEVTGSNSDITYQDLPEDDPSQRKPDISKADKILKWSPQHSLENGLIKTLKYFK